MIRYARACTDEREVQALREALERGYYGHAEKVVAFEEAIQQYLGESSRQVVCVNNGTDALHLALEIAGVGPGDEVLVPSLTFVSCYQAIAATGATPVSCDVHPDTLLLNVADAEARITSRTRAIMPVHYCGAPCDMDALMALRERYGARIIEDAAHAFGSHCQDRLIGSLGDITCFSFDSIKTLTCGEGGAIVFSSADEAAQARRRRNLGIDRQTSRRTQEAREWEFDVAEPGYRYHMSNLNAAVGLVQLEKFEGFLAWRRQVCHRYDKAFRSIRGFRLLPYDYDSIAPFMYVVRVRDGQRDALWSYLRERGVETAVCYMPNHYHLQFKGEPGDLPAVEEAYEEILSLPLHACLTNDEVEYVIQQVYSFFQERV